MSTPVRCEGCAQPLESDARFCPHCGRPVPRHSPRPQLAAAKGPNRVPLYLAAGLTLVFISLMGTFAVCWIIMRGTSAPNRPTPPAPQETPLVQTEPAPPTPEVTLTAPTPPSRQDDRGSAWLDDLKDPRTRELAKALESGDRQSIQRNVLALQEEAVTDPHPALDAVPRDQRSVVRAWAARRGHLELVRLFSDEHREIIAPTQQK